MNYNLREVLHAINVLGDDIDITVDGYDTIAVVAPITLTDKAKEHFAKALDLSVDDMVVVGDNDEDLHLAWDLLYGLAGYCPCDKFDEWFECDNEI